MNASTHHPTPPTSTSASTLKAAATAPRAEAGRREAEHRALLTLANEVKRLDRQIQRERSYASLRYAG